MTDKLFIYSPRHRISLEKIHGLFNSPNRLGTSNNQLLKPKVEGFDIESFSIIKRLT